MVALLPNPELQFIDADGHPYAGGTLATYEPGTTTPKTTWVDPNQSAANTNPIILNSAGRCIVFGDGAYRCILRDSVGNLVFDQYSDTIVSAAMQPVMSAATIEDAVALLGIDDMIAAEAAARAAADSAEQTARIAADNALGARIDAETAARIAADDALNTRIDDLPSGGTPGVTGVQGGAASLDGSGFYHLVFPSPFVTQCDSVVVSTDANIFVSQTHAVDFVDRFSCNIRGTVAGSATPAAGAAFMWLALGH